MQRRTFLFGGVALTLGGGAVIGLRKAAPRFTPRGPLFVLDAETFDVLAVAATRVVIAPDVDPPAIAHGADLALRFATLEAQGDVRLALNLLQNGLSGLIMRRSASLFTDLDPEAQDRALERWLESPSAMIRGAANAIRKLCFAGYYAPLAAAKNTGYPGPLFEKPDPGPIEPFLPLSAPFVRTSTGALP